MFISEVFLNIHHIGQLLVASCFFLFPCSLYAEEPEISENNSEISFEEQPPSSSSDNSNEAALTPEEEAALSAATPADATENNSEISSEAQQPSPSSDNSNEAALTPEEEAALIAAMNADAAENNDRQQTDTASNNAFVAAIQSFNPDMALIADFALSWFSEKQNYQTGAHDPTKTGFQLQQLEMSLSASVDHYFRFDSNLVFSTGGVEIEEAYVTTLEMPCSLQLRVGQFLSRMGRINATHPHSWDFVDQPFVIGKFFGSEGNRGLGLELSWLTPLPWYLELSFAVQNATSNASNRSYLGASDTSRGIRDFLYTATIKQFFAPSGNVGIFWGLSAQFGPNDTGHDNRTEIYATDLHIKYSSTHHPEMFVTLQAEAFFRHRQIPHDSLWDGAGYAQLVWNINKEWATGIRGEYGSGLSNDPLDAFWEDDRWRATYQATWMPTHFSRLRGQFSVDIPKWQEKPIYALMLSFEILAGTHPAHNY